MMMAAGAESPSVATQSAKTDILQKIGQAGNNHQNLESLEETDCDAVAEENPSKNNNETDAENVNLPVSGASLVATEVS